MTFSYKEFTNGGAGTDLWNEVTNELQTYNAGRQASAKITASDQRKGDARALIISCDVDIMKIPDLSSLSNGWASKEFTTGSNYNAMYQQCVDFLNGKTLTDAQSYYARIGMTNAEGIDSHLVVFYRLPH